MRVFSSLRGGCIKWLANFSLFRWPSLNVKVIAFAKGSVRAACGLQVSARVAFATALVLSSHCSIADSLKRWDFSWTSGGECYTAVCGADYPQRGVPLSDYLVGRSCHSAESCAALDYDAIVQAMGTTYTSGHIVYTRSYYLHSYQHSFFNATALESTASMLVRYCYTWTNVNTITGEAGSSSMPNCVTAPSQAFRLRQYVTCSGTCGVYVSARKGQCGCPADSVGDPIVPSSGAVFHSEVDGKVGAQSNVLDFKRFYNSAAVGQAGVLSKGWRHSYARSITPRYASTRYATYEASPDNSSVYPSEQAACTQGFEDIRSRAAGWTSTTVSYSSGACILKQGSSVIGSLALLYTSQPSPAGSTLIGFDAVRDDGQTISFILYNGSLAAPSGVSLKLQQVSGSFLLVNSDDSIETYNASGKLQTIAHPEGTTKTMWVGGAGPGDRGIASCFPG